MIKVISFVTNSHTFLVVKYNFSEICKHTEIKQLMSFRGFVSTCENVDIGVP